MPTWILTLAASIKPLLDLLNKVLGLIFPNPSATKVEQQNREDAEKEADDLKHGGRPKND